MAEQNGDKTDPTAAESFIWDTFRRRLEEAGKGEAALQLKHFLKADLRSSEESVRGLTTFRFEMNHRVSDYSVRLDAADGGVMGWLFGLLGEKSSQELPPEEALRKAEEVADLPEGAQLTLSEYRDLAGAPVFHARWEHLHDGIPVEGDHIHVLVNGRTGRAFSLSRKWHTVRL